MQCALDKFTQAPQEALFLASEILRNIHRLRRGILVLGLAHLLDVPVDIISQNHEDPGQIVFDCFEESQVHVGVLDDVDHAFLRLAAELVDILLQHAVGLLRVAGQHSQIRPGVSEGGAEQLGHQKRRRVADPLVSLRKDDLQHGLVLIRALVISDGRILGEVDAPGTAQVVVVAHVQIAGGGNLHACAHLGDLQIHHGAGADQFFFFADFIGAQLPVIMPVVVLVRGAVQHAADLRRDGVDAVVFAVVNHELSRHHQLGDVLEKSGVNGLCLQLFVLHHEEGILQGVGEALIENSAGNAVVVDPFGDHVFIHPGAVDDSDDILADIGVAVDQIGEGAVNIPRRIAENAQLVGDVILLDRLLRHHQNQTDHRVALGFGIMRCHRGHGVGVGHENAAVAPHVVPHEIVLGDDIDKTLLAAAGQVGPQGGEEVAELIFHDDEGLAALSGSPQVGGKLQAVLQRRLLVRQMGIAADLGVVLSGEPADIAHGHLLLAVPEHLPDLVL